LRDFEVALDGETWRLEPLALEIGAGIALPDGSRLFLKSVRRRWWSIGLRDELLVERDGVPLPGSDGDPRVIGRRAARLIGLFGVLSLGFGVALVRFDEASAVPRPGHLVALEGLVLIVLAVLAASGRRLPIALAAFMLLADSLLPFALGITARPMGLLIRGLVVAHLVGTWRRLRPRPTTAAIAAVFD
jgi:hypothetical protein